MDAATAKLGKKLKDKELAAALVEAGLDSPKKIKRVKQKDLEKVVGKDKAKKAKDKFGGD